MSATAMVPRNTTTSTDHLRAEITAALKAHWQARQDLIPALATARHLTALDVVLGVTMDTCDPTVVPDLRVDTEVPSPLGRGLLSAAAVHAAVDRFCAGDPAALVLIRGAVREHRDRARSRADAASAAVIAARARVEALADRARAAGVTVPWS